MKTTASLDGVKTRGDNFLASDLARAVHTTDRNARIVSAYQTHTPARQAVVFTTCVDHAHHIAAAFEQHGVCAPSQAIPTTIPDVRSTPHTDGATSPCSRARWLTEGWDETVVDVVVHARPMRSRTLYVQAHRARAAAIGRRRRRARADVGRC